MYHLLSIALLLVSASTYAQTTAADRAATREDHVSCASIAMVGLATTPQGSQTEYRRLLSHFLASAAAMDVSRSPLAAATASSQSAHLLTVKWLSGLTAKDLSEEDGKMLVAKLKAETESCVSLFKAHVSGLKVQ